MSTPERRKGRRDGVHSSGAGPLRFLPDHLEPNASIPFSLMRPSPPDTFAKGHLFPQVHRTKVPVERSHLTSARSSYLYVAAGPPAHRGPDQGARVPRCRLQIADCRLRHAGNWVAAAAAGPGASPPVGSTAYIRSHRRRWFTGQGPRCAATPPDWRRGEEISSPGLGVRRAGPAGAGPEEPLMRAARRRRLLVPLSRSRSRGARLEIDDEGGGGRGGGRSAPADCVCCARAC